MELYSIILCKVAQIQTDKCQVSSQQWYLTLIIKFRVTTETRKMLHGGRCPREGNNKIKVFKKGDLV